MMDDGGFVKRVILADRSQESRHQLKDLLEKMKCSVAEALDGEDAVRKGSSGNYDALIMDLSLPILDGFQVISILQKREVDIPIIVMSGKFDKNKILKLMQCGVNSILAKPITKRKLD
ncbi:MAG: response regulator, partial [bacterium]|nr:response regulator [bacterium]